MKNLNFPTKACHSFKPIADVNPFSLLSTWLELGFFPQQT